MKILSTYKTKILHYNHIFEASVQAYRDAVSFFIDVCLKQWGMISVCSYQNEKKSLIEKLTIPTQRRPSVIYNFPEADARFHKFPSYLRRSAIAEAVGKVSSYKSHIANWEKENPKTRGKKPGIPNVGNIYPVLYRGNMYEWISDYEMKIKVWIRNTWDWLPIRLRKSDVDYIRKHCSDRKQLSPTLQRRYKNWFLDFPFEEDVKLKDTPVQDRIILAVDLGINNACTCCALKSDGTVLGRRFLRTLREEDSLMHAANRIRKAQSLGNHRMPRLWGIAKGINKDISVKTAQFIIDVAVYYNADIIIFEALDLTGKKKGKKKQRLHHWRAKYVQEMVTNKAHRLGMRISRVCAWNTSRLAYDGSGRVSRGKDADLPSYSLCRFSNGKIYNCDLNASYNIGARYFIREILKSLPARVKLDVQAKVPELSKRTTSTLSSLIRLYAVLYPLGC